MCFSGCTVRRGVLPCILFFLSFGRHALAEAQEGLSQQLAGSAVQKQKSVLVCVTFLVATKPDGITRYQDATTLSFLAFPRLHNATLVHHYCQRVSIVCALDRLKTGSSELGQLQSDARRRAFVDPSAERKRRVSGVVIAGKRLFFGGEPSWLSSCSCSLLLVTAQSHHRLMRSDASILFYTRSTEGCDAAEGGRK